MQTLANPFIEHVHGALVDVTDPRLVEALLSGFEHHPHQLEHYRDTYRRITSGRWTTASLCTFFCGWRSPDGAAHAVSSIIVRMLQESEALAGPRERALLLDAARHCGEIIVEDIGLGEMHGHPHHSKLYHRLASAICGSDDWRLLDRYLDPTTKLFSGWVGQKRPLAPDLMEALEMMAMTELFNTGEYNLMTPLWKQWIRDTRDLSATEVNHVAAFLSVHCGSVEARHFRHAADALTLYASATGRPLDYPRIEALSNEYVLRACEHLGRMAAVLREA